MEIFSILNEFNIWSILFRLVLSALVGGVIGFERGKHGHDAGLRTHILICIGAAVTSLTGVFLNETLGNNGDLARLSAQVISGIGFLGAGTIIVRNRSIIRGLTTAAGMWTTAVIGIALGYGFYLGAIFATLIYLFCVTVFGKVQRKNAVALYIELSDITKTGETVSLLQTLGESLLNSEIITAKSGHIDNVGILALVSDNENSQKLAAEIEKNPSVVMVIKNLNV